jgi:outer membrane protein OmpA-like peptidoglycan-associated protein
MMDMFKFSTPATHLLSIALPTARLISAKSQPSQRLYWALMLSLVCACSNAPKIATGIVDVRNDLNALQANNELATLAPTAVSQAEAAVLAAEQPVKNEDLSRHLVFVADRKVNIAWAQAQSRYAEDQLSVLAKARDEARLNSRTEEANLARQDARLARSDAADARLDADNAQAESLNAQQQSAELQAQIKLLNAKQSERGWVVTLGDVLFDTGKANLKTATSQHLGDLAQFLTKYPLRGAIIEGHTDSVGASDYNQGLSQQRADSVRNFLLGRGIQSSRMSSSGKGEQLPIAGNDSASGRQQNRRVEVIITETERSVSTQQPATLVLPATESYK